MFTVIGCMFAGMLFGFLLRRQRPAGIHRIITVLIWLLLFLLGTEVGGNRELIRGLHTLGMEALAITLAAVAGSVVAAGVLWRRLCKKGKEEEA